MSNLTLPTMTYQGLSRVIGERSDPVKIAYATTAQMRERVIAVKHFDTEVAYLTEDWIILGSQGWTSQTTARRLHEILVDNGVAPEYTVNCRKPSRDADVAVLGLFKAGGLVRDIAAEPVVFHRHLTGFRYCK